MAPIVENLYTNYKDKVSFLSICGSYLGVTVDAVAKFIQTYKSTWPYAYDATNAVPTAYGLMATPTFFFIKDGLIAAKHVGDATYETLAGYLDRLAS